MGVSDSSHVINRPYQVNSKSKGILDRSNPDLVEKYAVIGSGTAECNSCQFVYDPVNGDPNYPVPKGVRFEARQKWPNGTRQSICSRKQRRSFTRSPTAAAPSAKFLCRCAGSPG